MAYVPYKGATYLAPFNGVPHLFVIMNDPCVNRLCLIVMLTSVKDKRKHDTACIINAGEHQFVTKPTYVLYRLADYSLAAHIGKMVDKGYYMPWPDVKPALFQRICDGLYKSNESRPSMCTYAKSVGI